MASTSSSSSKPPPKPPVVQPGSGNAIIINPCQRLNPILESIRNVNKEFGDIVPDFQLGRTTCALFLSLKYHRLHPEYIHQRIQRIGNTYNLRILLLMCDISQHQDPIRELTKVCLINNMTMMVAWTPEEAGQYLSTYKAFEFKSPNLIKERVDKDYPSMLRSSLTSISKVNKMDVETLRTSFGSFSNVAKANSEQLRSLPGFGPVKVRRVVDAFNKSFRNNATSALASSQTRTPGTQTQLTSLSQLAVNALGGDGRVEALLSSGTASAEMLPPPLPSAKRVAREPSPTWDIELDLNDDEIEALLISSDNSLKEKASAGTNTSSLPSSSRASSSKDVSRPSKPTLNHERETSPPWDIELDLNDEDDQGPRLLTNTKNGSDKSAFRAMPSTIQSPHRDHAGAMEKKGEETEVVTGKRKRPPSPVWDIELDLNESD